MRLNDRSSIFIINILVSVHHVILQQFQIRQIIFRLPALLVIVEHRTGVDVQPVKYFRHDLICRKVHIFLFQSDIVPDHIIRIVEITAFQILCLQIHGGQMIPVEYEHRRFIPRLDRLDQLAGELIHLMHKIHIIFPCISLSFILHAADNDLRIVQHFLRGIFSVSLHADREHEILSFRRIHGFHDIRHEDVVRRPAFRRGLQDVHEFLACVMIKSHVVEHFGTAVEITAVVVERLCPVPEILQRRSRALHRIELGICLVRILTRSEETHAHAGQHFILRIGRAGAHGRDFKISA